MKVLGVLGSPRIGGNSDILIYEGEFSPHKKAMEVRL